MAERPRYEVFDGLRGVAALAVVWLHISQNLSFGVKPPNAHLAVDFFFCLSGFVVAHAYGERLRCGMTFFAFARVRLIRLWPVAALAVLVGGTLILIKALTGSNVAIPNLVGATMLNMVMLPSGHLLADYPNAYATDPPLWSLGWELAINAAFALLAVQLSTRLLAGILVVGAALISWTSLTHNGLNVGWTPDDFELGSCRVLYPFAAGVLIQRLPIRQNRFGVPLGAALACILLGPSLGSAGEAVADLLVLPAVVWLGAGSTLTGRAAAASIWLGELSYPLYVIHYPILRILVNAAAKLHVTNHVLLGLAASAAVISAALCALRFYDRPVRALLTAALARPKLSDMPAE